MNRRVKSFAYTRLNILYNIDSIKPVYFVAIAVGMKHFVTTASNSAQTKIFKYI